MFLWRKELRNSNTVLSVVSKCWLSQPKGGVALPSNQDNSMSKATSLFPLCFLITCACIKGAWKLEIDFRLHPICRTCQRISPNHSSWLVMFNIGKMEIENCQGYWKARLRVCKNQSLAPSMINVTRSVLRLNWNKMPPFLWTPQTGPSVNKLDFLRFCFLLSYQTSCFIQAADK